MSLLRRSLAFGVNACLRPIGLQVARIRRIGELLGRIEELEGLAGRQNQEILRLSRRSMSLEVQQALNLGEAEIARPAQQAFSLESSASDALPTSRDLFSFDGVALPCWQESDLALYDDWLVNPDNYPVYYSVLRQLTSPAKRTRLLEIGVRTGYLAVVFARASQGPAFYLGVDPNEYVQDGLELAASTLRILRQCRQELEFVLIEGYSWDLAVQQSLAHSGPFDLIHIDGDHSLPGKLIDLDLARRLVSPEGCVLVDDYDYHAPVGEAVARAWTRGWFRELAYVPSMRGLAILKC